MIKYFSYTLLVALTTLSVSLPFANPLTAQQYPVQLISVVNSEAPTPVLFPIDSPYNQVQFTWNNTGPFTSFVIETIDENFPNPIIQPGDTVQLVLFIEPEFSAFEARLIRNSVIIGTAAIPGVVTSWCLGSNDCKSTASYLVLQPAVAIPEPATMLVLGGATLLSLMAKKSTRRENLNLRQ